MLLIDVPVGLIAGQVIADAGRNMLRSGDRQKYRFLRTTTLVFAFCFITPIVIYFFSFFENPFFIYWLILTLCFWGSLLVFFLWVRKKDKAE